MLAQRIMDGSRSLAAALNERRLPARITLLRPGLEGRAVAAYETPRGRFVGKFYEDESGWRSAELQRGVVRRLSAWPRRTVLAVPRVVGYAPNSGCLLQEYAPGIDVEALLSPVEGRHVLGLAGRALSELHALPRLDAPHKSLADHVRELIRPHPSELIPHFATYGGAIRCAMERMLENDATGDVSSTPLHRDFHVRQLRYDGRRVWLLDWDAASNGDPAFDVAYMAVYLDNHLPDRAAEEAVSAFTAGYLELGDPAVMDRIGIYRIFNFLRRACRRLRLRDAGWREEAERMLVRMRAATVLHGRTPRSP